MGASALISALNAIPWEGEESEESDDEEPDEEPDEEDMPVGLIPPPARVDQQRPKGEFRQISE